MVYGLHSQSVNSCCSRAYQGTFKRPLKRRERSSMHYNSVTLMSSKCMPFNSQQLTSAWIWISLWHELPVPNQKTSEHEVHVSIVCWYDMSKPEVPKHVTPNFDMFWSLCFSLQGKAGKESMLDQRLPCLFFMLSYLFWADISYIIHEIVTFEGYENDVLPSGWAVWMLCLSE